MMSAFSPGSTTKMQLDSETKAIPPIVNRLLNLLLITNDYILIQMMQEKYTKNISGYRLTDRLLGTGSFSQVFLAYARDRRRLAVKVIPRTQISESDISGFQSEVELLRSLKHENIVELIDFKKSHNNFYLFLQYCQGGNLADYIKKSRRLPQPQAIKIFAQILRGISAMHQFKVMHRDLKPANILLHNGRVKIADFGLACKFSKEEMLRSFAGTPLNMAPQILKGHLYNQRVDIYSAGTVLYQMLYGVLPFGGKNTRTLIQSIEKCKMAESDVNVSQNIRILLLQMLKPEPNQRISLKQLLDFVYSYEKQKLQQRIRQYRNQSLAGLNWMGAIGGLSCQFDLQAQVTSRAYDMDMKLYNKMCRRLSCEVMA